MSHDTTSNLNRTQKDDCPAQALSVLYEANDLLNALRIVDTEDSQQMGSTAWTLTTEISRRLDSAIAHLRPYLLG